MLMASITPASVDLHALVSRETPDYSHFIPLLKIAMRISSFNPVIYTCIAFFALPQLAAGQQNSVEPVPPKLERLEEGEIPAKNIPSPDMKTNIEETRERGQVTSIRVQSGNSTYYVKPDTPAGSALRDDAQRGTTRAAQWKVFEFDWSREPDKAKEAAAQAATIAPPPPAPAAQQKKQ